MDWTAKKEYQHIYKPLFKPYRDKSFNMLEIGVWHGDSLLLWSKLFPKAQIYGIDTQPSSIHYYAGNVTTYLINQCDKKELTRLAENVGKFEIIIDDGSHQRSDIEASYAVLKNYTNLYIIEDVMNDAWNMGGDWEKHTVDFPKIKNVGLWINNN